MKKSITYKKAQILNNVISNYFVNNGFWDVEKKQFSTKETKLSANMKNIKKQAEKIEVEYQEKVEDLRLDHCATDPVSKVILTEVVYDKEGKNVLYQNKLFTQQGTKDFNNAVKELLEKPVDINVRITEGDWGLNDEQKEVFNGILIPEFEITEELDLDPEPESSEKQ